MSTAQFLDAVKNRRTYYQLGKNVKVSDDRIVEIVEQTMLHTPSSFNSQSTRAVVLLGAEHDKLWEDIVKPTVKAVAPAEMWESTSGKLDSFKAGYGTVLFFEDPDPVTELQKKFALYADKFPQWSEHTNGMHTYVAWTALEAEGLGCSLQHYNPLIDLKISETFDVPKEWQLKSQLVIGSPEGKPGEKTFQPLEKRLLIRGKK